MEAIIDRVDGRLRRREHYSVYMYVALLCRRTLALLTFYLNVLRRAEKNSGAGMSTFVNMFNLNSILVLEYLENQILPRVVLLSLLVVWKIMELGAVDAIAFVWIVCI